MQYYIKIEIFPAFRTILFLVITVCVFNKCVAFKVNCHKQCVSVTECAEAYALVRFVQKNGIDNETRSLLQNVYCGKDDGGNRLVCCDLLKLYQHRNVRLLPEQCGPNADNKIFGGVAAAINEFPWMALVGIRNHNRLSYPCGGSVISARYVLTAAHCVRGLDVAAVRVGEHNLRSSLDCEGNLPVVCADRLQNIPVETSTVHDNFTAGHHTTNDIALLRLRRPVNFQRNNAKPICLPTTYADMTRSLDDVVATIAGWGVSEDNASVLTKARVTITSQQQCADTYEGSSVHARFRTPVESFLCAGDPGRDSCRGDSGGPLMVTGLNHGYTRYIQYGIISFGDVSCGGDRPGFYSDVAYHIIWILDNLKA